MSTESRHNLPVEAIQQALGSETVLTPPPHERGIRFTTPNVTVDVWPERQAVRITAEDSQHYFRNLEHTGISQDGMVLFGSTNPDRPKTVGVNYHGEVSIFERPREPTFAEFIAAGIEPPSEQVPSPAPEPAALPVRERGE